jgi:DNA helicase II / ATP-dependent DNA helicase PcrA
MKPRRKLSLNEEQQLVVDAAEYLDDNLIVDSRAGTGKTTTCIKLVSKLRGTVWICAFGNRIAAEIDAKVQANPDIDKGYVRVSTVHKAGNSVGRRHLRFGKVEKFKVRAMVEELALKNPNARFNMWRIIKLVDLAKQTGVGVLHAIESPIWYDIIDHFGMDLDGKRNWEPIVELAKEVYMRSLELARNGIQDFSDMLLAPLYYKCQFPQYDNIVIDEAQDISPLRLRLILSCLKPGGRVIAVGDPFQAIFGFTGADDRSMERIADIINPDRYKLTVSFRCPQASIVLARTWVPDIQPHPDAIPGKHIRTRLHDDPTGAEQWLTIWDCQPFTANDVVLCRNNKPLVALAHDMLRRQIPCYVEGREQGMGLVALIKRWPGAGLSSLESSIGDWRDDEVARLVAAKQNYKAEYVNDQAETLFVLIDAVREDGGTSVQSLLALIDRMFKDTDEYDVPRCITLSSIHRAKGKEWRRVFWLGRERYQPSQFAVQDWELQQETNLMYVAATRNIQELIEVIDNSKPKRRNFSS